MISESDEIRIQRQDPTSHPLQTKRSGLVVSALTTLIMSTQASYTEGVVFRQAARDLFRQTPVSEAKFWFYANNPDTVDFAEGTVRSWDDDGEIHFTDGTRLNDRLLLRVTF